jgi:hypothetical protein
MGPIVSLTVPLMLTLPENTGRPFDEVLGVADAGVGHQPGEALGLHGVTKDVTECAGFLVLPCRSQDDISGFGVVDGHLQHEVVPGGAADSDGGAAEGHGPVDGLDPGAEGALPALGFVDGRGRETGKPLDGVRRRPVNGCFDVNHVGVLLLGIIQLSAWTALSMAATDSSMTSRLVA